MDPIDNDDADCMGEGAETCNQGDGEWWFQ